jgi:hypothetical protein
MGETEMKISTLGILVTVILGVLTSIVSSPASARSCSEQSGECKSWARSNVPDPARQAGAIAICSAEIPICVARCKRGEKYFIGIGGSNQYPIDTCK